MNIKENLQLFEEMSGVMEANGLEVTEQIREYLQEYLNGNETFAQANARLKALLAEVK